MTAGRGSPALHQITFNDGNYRQALDPHDPRSLRLARNSDPVVLSDDLTLGQKVPAGFTQVPVVLVGGASAVVAVACTLALVTNLVHGGFSRFLLVVMTLAAVLPAVRFLPGRLRNRNGAIAIGHGGVTIHRRGKELHLAWVEIKGIKVAMTTHHPRLPRPESGGTKLQARSQILLAPAVPGGFDTHKGSGLLRLVARVGPGGLSSKGPGLLRLVTRGDDALVSAHITYSHAVPLRHRLYIDDDHLPEPVALVDAALKRFAGDRYARPKVTRRQRPFLW